MSVPELIICDNKAIKYASALLLEIYYSDYTVYYSKYSSAYIFLGFLSVLRSRWSRNYLRPGAEISFTIFTAVSLDDARSLG